MLSIRMVCVLILFFCWSSAGATDFHVGPGQSYVNIGDVAWESLSAGDTVFIHARPEPYYEKWVLNRVGTAVAPITVRGVPDADGKLPVIHGEDATTRLQLDYWNENRGILKIGGSSIPADGVPAYIVVENLHFRRARGAFTDDSGVAGAYNTNAAGIYVEKGDHITVRNCIVEDNGNGIFVAAATSNMTIEGNHIYGNGNVGSAFEHNTYTEARGILYQNNRFGPLCSGCNGNNLKDRSSGTIIRNNWIEGGNRQMDLVDAEGSIDLVNDSAYLQTFAYGNVLIEPDDGNSQIVHFGGDSGTIENYRGTLYFWNNTVLSTRSGNTTLLRLSTNAQTAEVWNNIIHVTAAGNKLALTDSAGTLRYGGNLFKPGVAHSFSGLPVALTDMGGNTFADSPGFVDLTGQDFNLSAASLARNAARLLPVATTGYPLDYEYLKHQTRVPRIADGPLDIGAFEYHEPPRTLTVTVAGTGSGTIISDQGHPGITCPGTCQATYPYGTVVSLDPYPSVTSLFSGWSGDCRGDSCLTVMDTDKTVMALFNVAQVKNKTSGEIYATLDDALSRAGTGSELLLLGMQYNGQVSLNTGMILSGGWDTAFGVRNGTSTVLKDGLLVLVGDASADTLTVHGEISVKGGRLKVKDVVVQP